MFQFSVVYHWIRPSHAEQANEAIAMTQAAVVEIIL
jgi:hypothetical protein